MSGSAQPDFSREFLCSKKSERDHPQGLRLSLPAVPIYQSLALRPATKAGSPTLLDHCPLQIAPKPCQEVRGVESSVVQRGPRDVLSSPPPSAEPWVAREGAVLFHTCLLGGDREVWLQMKEKATE